MKVYAVTMSTEYSSQSVIYITSTLEEARSYVSEQIKSNLKHAEYNNYTLYFEEEEIKDAPAALNSTYPYQESKLMYAAEGKVDSESSSMYGYTVLEIELKH
jgi:hypothetical protein